MILTMEYGKSMKYALIFIFAALLSEGESSVRILRHQQIKRFHCINDHYILSSWFCDGFDDCGDFSDEAYGCSDLCGIGNFTCQDGTCLPIAVRCNVAKDCADGSDELFCDQEPDFKECTIPNGKFLCKDKLRCVELSHVCDGEYHCFDYSDENSKCDDYDHEICNLCFEGCYRTPDGPFCLYNGTFEKPAEAAYTTKCAFSENNCQQSCILFKGVKQCSCEENFIPVYTSEYETFYCEEKDKSKNMLVYATNKGEIRAIPGYANYTISIRKGVENITALAAGNENVYWAGLYGGHHVIGKSSFSGNDTKVIVSNGIGEVRAMDVDWRTGNIYFIDNIKKHIAACTASGSRCIEVKSLDNVATSIALAPKYGSMFWSLARNEEYGFSIIKAHMNGLWSSTFLEGGLRDVSVISIDEAARKLYWLDAVHRKISVAGFDSSSFSSGRRVFKSDIRMNYLSLAANAQYLYWIIRNNGTIFFTPQVRVSVGYALNGTDPVQHIYGYSYSEKTTKMEAPCSWGCEDGICLIHSRRFNRTGSACICNVSEIDSTGIWCRNNSRYYVYNIYGHYYDVPPYTSKVTEPHRTLLIVLCFVAIASAIVFYLYRKGFFNNIKLLPIGKFSLMNNMET